MLLMPSFLQLMPRRRASYLNGVLAHQEVLGQRVLHSPCSPVLLPKERKYSGRCRHFSKKKKQYNKKIAEVKASICWSRLHSNFHLNFRIHSSVVFAYSLVLILLGEFLFHKFSSALPSSIFFGVSYILSQCPSFCSFTRMLLDYIFLCTSGPLRHPRDSRALSLHPHPLHLCCVSRTVWAVDAYGVSQVRVTSYDHSHTK